MTDHRLTAERALKEITAALDTIAATITAALDNLATVDAPARTLAEELREEASWAEEMGGPVHGSKFRALADRAEQMEHERNTLEQQRDYWHDSEHQAVKDRDHLASEIDKANTDILHLTAERDEARSEVERLDAVAEDYGRRATAALTERDEARAEVERLTAVQKGAESNAETPDPADVKEEEPYHIYYGVYGNDHTIGVRIDGKWRCIGGDRGVHVTDTNIARLHRLVPAPRVITNAEDLKLAKRGTVIRDGVGVVCERAALGDGWFTTGHGTDQTPYIELPATVLWEPEA